MRPLNGRLHPLTQSYVMLNRLVSISCFKISMGQKEHHRVSKGCAEISIVVAKLIQVASFTWNVGLLAKLGPTYNC